jgi:hypothetical protein
MFNLKHPRHTAFAECPLDHISALNDVTNFHAGASAECRSLSAKPVSSVTQSLSTASLELLIVERGVSATVFAPAGSSSPRPCEVAASVPEFTHKISCPRPQDAPISDWSLTVWTLSQSHRLGSAAGTGSSANWVPF